MLIFTKKIIATAITLLLFTINSWGQFYETFDAGIPTGWDVVNNGDSNTWFVNNEHKAAQILWTPSPDRTYSNPFLGIEREDYLITPKFIVKAGETDRLEFDARILENLPIWGNGVENLQILILTDKNNLTSYQTVNNSPITINTMYWSSNKVDLTNFLGEEIYVAFYSNSTHNFSVELDNITVKGIPSCETPHKNTHKNNTENSTEIHWEAGGNETEWEYVLQDSATTTIPSSGTLTSVPSFKATSLVFGQNYKAYVRAKCSDTEFSDWMVYEFSWDYFIPTLDIHHPVEVTQVEIGNLIHTRESPGPLYADYSAREDLIINSTPGESIDVTITKNQHTPHVGLTLFIDWNKDLFFDSDYYSSEIAGKFADGGATTTSFTFPVPADVKPGDYRVRLGVRNNNRVEGQNSGRGFNFLDYTIRITDSSIISTGIINDCIPDESLNINFENSNHNRWVSFKENDDYIILLHANNQTLGATTVNFYTADNARQDWLDNFERYHMLSRNFSITTQYTPTNPISVRFLFKDSDISTSYFNKNKLNQIEVLEITDANCLQDIPSPTPVSSMVNNTRIQQDGYGTYSDGYYVEAKVNLDNTYTSSFFLIQAGASLLPVELASFEGEALEYSNNLTWTTLSENNNSHFEVERSSDGVNFETIGSVEGNGTTDKAISYTFEDKKPIGTAYYRLKQVDFDDSFEYSDLVTVSRLEKDNDKFIVYPVPTFDQVNVSIKLTNDALLLLTSTNGKVVLKKQVVANGGLNNFNVDLTSYPKGVYFLTIVDGEKTTTKKIVKQ